MKLYTTRLITWCLLLAALFSTTACIKNYSNPNAATEDQVIGSGSAKALTGAAIGLQRVYTAGRGSSLYNAVSINGFVTNEIILLNAGNIPELQLVTGGGAVDGTNQMLAGLWSTSNKILADADKIIASAQTLADKNYASGLISYVSIFKALSLGNLSEFWEKVPSAIGTNVAFIDRKDGYKKAITIIDNALSVIAANPVSATFLLNLPAGIDIPNTLYALKARYLLFTDQYAPDIATAYLVELTKKSVLIFDALNLNPFFETATATNNVFQPIDSTLGLLAPLQPDAADKRIPFYVQINTSIAPRFRISGFAALAATAWPFYLPGEITLIKAEAYTRQNDLVNGAVELNKVITKLPAADPFGVGAGLPPVAGLTQTQMLDQIYKQRSIELFMSGLKLEDMRRFGRPITERKRNLLPYPFIERDNNTNTPPDPTF